MKCPRCSNGTTITEEAGVHLCVNCGWRDAYGTPLRIGARLSIGTYSSRGFSSWMRAEKEYRG